MNKPLCAVVLAGGVGTRFWPFSTDKILMPFAGKPLIMHTVFDILPPDTSKVVLVTNVQNRTALESLKFPVPVTIVTQREPRGMADALLAAKPLISGSSLLIYFADHFIEKKLIQDVLHTARRTHAFGVLPAWKVDSYFPGGYLVLEEEKIRGIMEKPGQGNEPSHFVTISGHYIDDSDVLLNQLANVSSNSDDIYEKSISALAKHADFVMQPYKGLSSSLKYPWHVLNVTQDILVTKIKKYVGKNVDIRDHVTIEGDVYIDDDVRIFENSKITGPTYIGRGTIIGNNTIIRSSDIGNNCVCGFGTDMARSYIGDNCWFHANYIGDSVLEKNISMGSGTVLANLRLDESDIYSTVKGERVRTGKVKLGAMIAQNVRIGINVSIMPGIKIGSNSFISAGVLVGRDVPSDSYYSTTVTAHIQSNKKDMRQELRENFRNKLI